MQLALAELKTELFQRFLSPKISIIEAVTLNIYKHAVNTGSIYVEIVELDTGQVIATSNNVLLSDIPGTYSHGSLRFYINAYLKKNTEYKLVLKSSSHTFSESSFVGWNIDVQQQDYDATYTVTKPVNAPFSFSLYERKHKK